MARVPVELMYNCGFARVALTLKKNVLENCLKRLKVMALNLTCSTAMATERVPLNVTVRK